MNGIAGAHTYREIKGQTEAWDATLASTESIGKQLAAALKPHYDETLFTGCGSTYYLSLTAASIWQTLCHTRARALPASDVWLFPDSWVSNAAGLLVTLSRSGETTETLNALKTFQTITHGDSLAITCHPKSTLAQDTTLALATKDASETSIVQTRSFTSMLILFEYVAGLVSGRTAFLDELKCLPAHGMRLISKYESTIKSIAEDPRFNHFVFLGSGPMYGLACEAMLKMKEISLSWTEAFHFMEYRHGPKSGVGTNTLVVGLLGDTAFENEVAVLNELKGLGASILSLGESSTRLVGDYIVPLDSGLGELARGVLGLPLLQLLAFYRGLAKKLDPDLPTHLDAVVRL